MIVFGLKKDTMQDLLAACWLFAGVDCFAPNTRVVLFLDALERQR